MLDATLRHLGCPAQSGQCNGGLTLGANPRYYDARRDVRTGTLICSACHHEFLIVAGVALVVEDLPGYLASRLSTIRRLVDDDEFRELSSRAGPAKGPTRNDPKWESTTGLSRYFATSYARTEVGAPDWTLLPAVPPSIASILDTTWSSGIWRYLRDAWEQFGPTPLYVDLGCGVGGFSAFGARHADFTIGLDMSFTFVSAARSIVSGGLTGWRPRAVSGDSLVESGRSARSLQATESLDRFRVAGIDFAVSDACSPAIRHRSANVVSSFNLIDVVSDPAALVATKAKLLAPAGALIHASPYEWNMDALLHLRNRLGAAEMTSPDAVVDLYRAHGFEIVQENRDLPWPILSHARLVDLHSLHGLVARLRS